MIMERGDAVIFEGMNSETLKCFRMDQYYLSASALSTGIASDQRSCLIDIPAEVLIKALRKDSKCRAR
jgi:hypothetical protein